MAWTSLVLYYEWVAIDPMPLTTVRGLVWLGSRSNFKPKTGPEWPEKQAESPKSAKRVRGGWVNTAHHSLCAMSSIQYLSASRFQISSGQFGP